MKNKKKAGPTPDYLNQNILGWGLAWFVFFLLALLRYDQQIKSVY